MAHGLRFVEYPDGHLERAADLLPDEGGLGVLALPAALDGGYLFWVKSDRATDLFRAANFTSPLRPLARLPFEVAEVVVAFDRLLVVSADTRAAVGLDASTGAVADVRPLPPASAYGAMAFSGSFLGAVIADLRGALITFDAGDTWHVADPPLSTSAITEGQGRILLSTARGVFRLGSTGELERFDPRSSVNGQGLAGDEDESDGEDTEDMPDYRPASGPLGLPTLAAAVLRGIPDSPTTAIVAANGVLGRVSLPDARLLAQRPGAFPPGATCQAVPLRGGIGFACGEDLGPTVVHALDRGFEVRPVLEFREPRRVHASGNGALVVSGGCPGSATDPRAYCVVPTAGPAFDLRIEGDAGVERVVPLADGRVAVVAPPRLGLRGAITLLRPGEMGTERPLDLARVPEEVRPLVSGGLWTDGMIEIEPGILSGWAVASSSFVGVQVALDGTVRVGSVRSGFPRAQLSGRYALLLGERGEAHETTDGGRVWSEVLLPDVGLGRALPEGDRGCTAVGCGLGGWVRIGWGESSEPPVVPTPKQVQLDPASIVTWALDCAPTGVTSAAPAARPSTKARRSGRAPEERGRLEAIPAAALESSAFRAFMGVPSPPLGEDELGFDFGTESHAVQVRGYVWGARGAYWDRTGTWLVRGADRFRVRSPVWSTAPSRPPWPDSMAAAEVFAADPSRRTSSEWGAFFDPSGDGGLLFTKTGVTTELFVVEAGRAIVPVRNTGDFSLEQPAGAVRALGRWFFASASATRALQLRSIEEGRVRSVGAYPRIGGGSPARVVRTSRGDAVGLWVIQNGSQGQRGGGDTWFIHAADPRSGVLGPPLVIPRAALTRTPRACLADEEGWVLEYEISPSKSRVAFRGASQGLAIEHLEARLLASERGLCVDALAARVDGSPPGPLVPPGGARAAAHGVTLALTDRATDSRWEFRCSP